MDRLVKRISIYFLVNSLIISSGALPAASLAPMGAAECTPSQPAYLVTLPNEAGTAVIARVVPPSKTMPGLWESPEAAVAIIQLISVSRGVIALHQSGLLGTGAELQDEALRELKRNIDGTVTEALIAGAERSSVRIRVRSGEGEVPKAEDEGEQSPGLYMDREYGGLGIADANVVDAVYDPIDGTTSAAKGPEIMPEAPTALAAAFKATQSWPETTCLAVMGPRSVPVDVTSLMEGERLKNDAVAAYLARVAKEKGKMIHELRIAAHFKDKKIHDFFETLGITLVKPSTMLEQLYMIPSCVDLPGAHGGALDVLIGNKFGTPEIVMCCLTLAALGRAMTIQFSVDGKTKFRSEEILAGDAPVFQAIGAARAVKELGLNGPRADDKHLRMESLLVTGDGAVYTIAFDFNPARFDNMDTFYRDIPASILAVLTHFNSSKNTAPAPEERDIAAAL